MLKKTEMLKVRGQWSRSGESRGSSESCSRLERRVRRDSMAKQTTKIAARQVLMRMVMARTFTRLLEQVRGKTASRALMKAARILFE